MRTHHACWPGASLLAVLLLCTFCSAAAAAAETPEEHPGSKKRAEPKPKTKSKESKPIALPWKLDHVYRYLWLRDGERVGETQFRISKIPSTEEPGGFLYELTSGRNYDHQQSSQRARLLSYYSADGTPIRFHEELHVRHLQKFVSIQETNMELVRNKARVTFTQKRPDGKPKQEPKLKERKLPDGTFLFSSQAVEHWAVFVGLFPKDFQTQTVKLFYPQFNKIFELSFRRQGVEKIRLGKSTVRSYRSSFRSPEIKGSIWTDAEGRLLQIEFPSTKVRVVLEALQ